MTFLTVCGIIVLLAVIVIIICMFFEIVLGQKSEKLKNQNKEKILQIKEVLISAIISDFNNAGWTNWEPSVHRKEGQLERLQRATAQDRTIQLCQYNPKVGIAKIKGSRGNYYLVNGNRCSCPDFRERKLPCKHMYFLATALSEYKNYLNQYLNKNSWYANKPFWGLKFSIVGRNQEKVKNFILKNGGSFGNKSWKETSAVVLASDIITQRLQEAKAKDVEILTFDELKTLFNNVIETDFLETDE